MRTRRRSLRAVLGSCLDLNLVSQSLSSLIPNYFGSSFKTACMVISSSTKDKQVNFKSKLISNKF